MKSVIASCLSYDVLQYMNENAINRGLPSVAMVVLGYNQEKSIAYAIDSALAQDYQGEIILVLSDDCSCDGTFRIMQKKAEAYKGPHKVILNRNETNLKYAGNLLKALELAGECKYQCKCDGDDFSSPSRVSALVSAMKSNEGASYALSRVHIVNVEDGHTPDFQNEKFGGEDGCRIIPYNNLDVPGLGCVALWRRDVLENCRSVFSAWTGIGEDVLLMNISRLYGDVVLVEKELIHYVISPCNSSWVSRKIRYSSLRNFCKMEEKIHKINSSYLPWKKKTVEVLRTYMSEHPELDSDRCEQMKKRLRLIEEDISQIERTLAYRERHFLLNVFHWLKYRDASPANVLPIWLKGLIGIVLYHLKNKR